MALLCSTLITGDVQHTFGAGPKLRKPCSTGIHSLFKIGPATMMAMHTALNFYACRQRLPKHVSSTALADAWDRQARPSKACRQCWMHRCRNSQADRIPHLANTAAATDLCQTSTVWITHLHWRNIYNFEALQVDGAIIVHVAPQLMQDGQHRNIGLACSRGGTQQNVVCSKQGGVADLQGPRVAVRRF